MSIKTKATDIFARAFEMKDEPRGTYLKSACGEDAKLRLEVERLLVDAAKADSFFANNEGATMNAEHFHASYSEQEGDQVGPTSCASRLEREMRRIIREDEPPKPSTRRRHTPTKQATTTRSTGFRPTHCEETSTGWASLAAGMAEFRIGSTRKALAYLTEALNDDRDLMGVIAHPYLAMSRHQQGDLDQARFHLDEAERCLSVLEARGTSPWHEPAFGRLALKEAEEMILSN